MEYHKIKCTLEFKHQAVRLANREDMAAVDFWSNLRSSSQTRALQLLPVCWCCGVAKAADDIVPTDKACQSKWFQ